MIMQTITCPKCNNEISIDAVLSQKIEADMKQKFDAQRGELEKNYKLAQENLSAEKIKIAAQEKELLVQKGRIEAEIESKTGEMQKRIKADYEQKLLAEESKLAKELEEKLSAKNKKELDALQEQIKSQNEKLDLAQAEELKLRKERVLLEEERKSFELEIQRKMDAERKQIEAKAADEAVKEQQLKLGELQKQLSDAQKANTDLTRKLQQGSQQNQGEVLELELEEMLRGQFIYDEILPVAKGVNGADVEQVVRDRFGAVAGKIIWELKQTKAWSEGWVSKLKEDQRRAGAELAVLVTTVLPKEVKNFGFYNGIWVANFEAGFPLATALRMQLLQLAGARAAAEGKDEKMEALYQYITGVQFRQKIEAVVEAFGVMQADLQTEKKAFQKIWAKREKQLEVVLQNTIGLHGNLEGLVGVGNLPQIGGADLDDILADEQMDYIPEAGKELEAESNLELF